MIITESRSQYIHFTEPYTDVGKSLLAYRRESNHLSLWTFLEPFDVMTRIAIVAVALVACFVFALSRRVSLSKTKKTDCKKSWWKSTVMKVSKTFWTFYTAAMQQSPDAIPSVSGKVLVAGWFFFCLVIVATYTANLTAFLTAKSFATNINSLHDLVQQTEVKYGTVNDSSIIDFLKSSKLSVHQRMYDYMMSVDDSLVDTAEDAIRRVQNPSAYDYIFIWDQPILDYVASHQPCVSHVIGRTFNQQAYGLGMPKGMPYADDFSQAILKMRESGIYESFSRKWLRAGFCDAPVTSSSVTDVEEIRIKDLQGVFVILTFAVGISVLVSIMERVWWRLRGHRKAPNADHKGDEVTLDMEVRYQFFLILLKLVISDCFYRNVRSKMHKKFCRTSLVCRRLTATLRLQKLVLLEGKNY